MVEPFARIADRVLERVLGVPPVRARPAVERALTVMLVVAGVLVGSLYVGRRVSRLPLTLLVGGAGALVLGLLAARRMPLALTLLVAASPLVALSIGTGTQSPINATILMVAGLTGLWVVRMLVVERSVHLVPSRLNGLLLAFLAVATLSWLASWATWDYRVPRPSNALFAQAGQYAVFVLSVAAFLLAANHRLSERVLKVWTLVIVAIGLAGAAYTWIFGRRPAALSGALLMWPFVLVFGQLLYNPKLRGWPRLLGWAMLALWPLWVVQRIYLPFKGGWMPALVAFALLALLHSRRTALTFIVVAATLVALLGAYLGFDWLYQQTVLSETQTASGLRWAIWLDVIRLGARSTILGLGPANYMYYWADPSFASISEPLWGHYDPVVFYQPPSHNVFVDIFAQTGILGLVPFTLAMIAAMRLGWRMRKRFPAGFRRAHVYSVLCGFTAMVAISVISADWLLPFVYNIGIAGFRHSVYSWLLLGTLVSLDHFTRDHPNGPLT